MYNGITGNVVAEDLYIPDYYKIDKTDFQYEKGWLDADEKGNEREQ